MLGFEGRYVGEDVKLVRDATIAHHKKAVPFHDPSVESYFLGEGKGLV